MCIRDRSLSDLMGRPRREAPLAVADVDGDELDTGCFEQSGHLCVLIGPWVKLPHLHLDTLLGECSRDVDQRGKESRIRVYPARGYLGDAHWSPVLGYENDIEPMLTCLLYTSPSPRDRTRSRMPSS